MRQIVLDTETTGLSPETGHRVIEIACVELIDRKLTGAHYHVYLNPLREVDEGAFKVHGISSEFLQDKPLFKDIVEEFIAFIDGSELIIHNAPFDVGFLNSELKLSKWPHSLEKHARIFDSLVYAREKHPGQRNSLDALCKRYEIDNSKRTFHGALLDAEILAAVYLAMTGGQASLFVENTAANNKNKPKEQSIAALNNNSPIQKASMEELAAHQEYIQFLNKKSGKNLWLEES